MTLFIRTNLVLWFFALSINLCAQQTPTTEPTGSPIDVPDIIIKGSATLKLVATSFTKQTPTNVRTLKKSELDSLNSLEKQAPQLIARSPSPSTMAEKKKYNGLLRVSMGLHQTPEALLSYATSVSGYHLVGQVDYASSNGYSTNTDFSSLGVRLQARYHAPMQYGMFGGSVTTTSISAASRAYTLFAVPDSAPRRSAARSAVSIDVVNNQQSVFYNASLTLGTSSVSDVVGSTTSDVRENRIAAGLNVAVPMNTITPSAYVRLDLRPYNNHTLSDNELGVGCRFGDSSLRINATLGVRGGGTSSEVTIGAPTATVRADLHASPFMSVHGVVESGLKNTFASEVIATNPFLNTQSQFAFSRHTLGVSAGANLHPSTTYEFSLDVGYDHFNTAAIFALDASRQFEQLYPSYTSLWARVTGSFVDSPHSALSLDLLIRRAQLANEVTVPYIPSLNVGARYHRTFAEKFDSDISLFFVGARNTSVMKESSIPGYVLLNANVQYALTEELGAFLRVENLLNSSIFVYESYRERDTFLALGLHWKF